MIQFDDYLKDLRYDLAEFKNYPLSPRQRAYVNLLLKILKIYFRETKSVSLNDCTNNCTHCTHVCPNNDTNKL